LRCRLVRQQPLNDAPQHRPARRGVGAAVASAAAEPGAEARVVTFDELACPICQTTRLPVRQEGGRPVGSLRCARCARTFTSTPTYVDLTLAAGAPPAAFRQRSWGGTELFRNPLISLAYERG
jgi:hypothetical protein